MRYENNDRLREYLDRGASGAYREHIRHPRFEFNEEAFAAALDQVRAQFPELSPQDADARAAFRLLTSGVAPEVAVPLPSLWYRAKSFSRSCALRLWPWLKLAWALAVILFCAGAVILLSALMARAEPTPENIAAYRNALRGASFLAAPAAQQPNGIILQFQQSGAVLATRPAGLVAFNCSTGVSCSFSGTTFTLTSTGGGGSGCVPGDATANALLYDTGSGTCNDVAKITWNNGTTTLLAVSGLNFNFSAASTFTFPFGAGSTITNAGATGQALLSNGDGTASFADPIVSGPDARGAAQTRNPVAGLAGIDYGIGCAGGPCVQEGKIDSSGNLYIGNFPAGFSVTNTPTVNQGTSPWVVSGSGTFAVTQSTSPWVSGITQWAGSTLGAIANYGTSLGAVLVPGVNAFVTNTPSVAQSGAWNVNQSGTWTVQPGNTANTTPWLFTINQGGNSASVTAGNALKVDGSAVTQPISASSLPLPTGAATSANQTNGSQKTQIVDGVGNVISSTSNNLNVQCANCSGSGASAADEATFTAASSVFAPNGGFFQTTATNNALTTGQQGMVQMTANRALFTNLRNASGTEIATAANPVRIDPTGTTTQPVSGTVAAMQSGNWSTRTQDGAGNNITSNSTTTTATQGLDINIRSILNTTPTTAGKLDVKGADGDVFVRQSTAANLNATVVGSLADNGASAATNRVGTLAAIAQTSYRNGTAATQGRDVTLQTGTDGLLWTAVLPAMRPASYMASASYAGSSTTDSARMPGNAANTILLTKIVVTCTQTTAGAVTLTVNKRSTAGSGGTSANMTVVPMDSTYAAGVSVPVTYTGTGPTVGTLVGQMDAAKLGCNATSTAGPNDVYVLDLSKKPIVLRGTAENVTVSFGGAITGGNLTTTFQWIETATITP